MQYTTEAEIRVITNTNILLIFLKGKRGSISIQVLTINMLIKNLIKITKLKPIYQALILIHCTQQQWSINYHTENLNTMKIFLNILQNIYEILIISDQI